MDQSILSQDKRKMQMLHQTSVVINIAGYEERATYQYDAAPHVSSHWVSQIQSIAVISCSLPPLDMNGAIESHAIPFLSNPSRRRCRLFLCYYVRLCSGLALLDPYQPGVDDRYLSELRPRREVFQRLSGIRLAMQPWGRSFYTPLILVLWPLNSLRVMICFLTSPFR